MAQVTRILSSVVLLGTIAASFMLGWASSPALAQQSPAPEISGVPGSPSATTTITGEQLPPAPPKFGGKIERNAPQSKPYWPARVVPPKGAPNILLIMTDDSGFGVPSTFGGVIPTPALDRIANNGLRYTQFHSTSLCSPTRAALITGRNHHSTGFGVIAELSTGYPGYDSIIGPENATTGLRHEEDRAHDRLPAAAGRTVQRGHGHPHAGGFQLRRRVPIHGHDQHADVQARTDAAIRRGAADDGESDRRGA